MFIYKMSDNIKKYITVHMFSFYIWITKRIFILHGHLFRITTKGEPWFPGYKEVNAKQSNCNRNTIIDKHWAHQASFYYSVKMRRKTEGKRKTKKSGRVVLNRKMNTRAFYNMV